MIARRWRRFEDAVLGAVLAAEHRVRKLPSTRRLSASRLDRLVFRWTCAALACTVFAFALPSRRLRVGVVLAVLAASFAGFLWVAWRDAQPGGGNRV